MRYLASTGIALLLLITAGAALLLASVSWTEYQALRRGIAVGDDIPQLQHSDVPRYGINTDLTHTDLRTLETDLDVIANGGFQWVRQRFRWRDIEPSPGVFDWRQSDALVAAYRRRALNVVAVLDSPPDWSRRDNGWPNRPPDNFEDFAKFAAVVARHYEGAVDHLQLWDEPNVFPNWGNRPVDPAEYVRLLAAVYPQIKAANPGAAVLLAGLAPNGESGGRNMSDLAYLAEIYQANGASYFDVAAAKPYGLWFDAMDRQVSPDMTNLSRVILWRETMVASGDSAKPIWAVEFGWNSLPSGWTGAPSPWGSVSEAQQAHLTVAALRRAQEEWPWLPVLILQGYQPHRASSDPAIGFSVVDGSAQPRPVYDAARAFILDAGAGVGRHSATSPELRFTGSWSRNSQEVRGQAGAAIGLGFSGERLDLRFLAHPGGLPARVTIDGVPANRLIKLGGDAWLDTAATFTHTENVTVADQLTPGQHELRLEVAGRQAITPQVPDEVGFLALLGYSVIREHLDYSPAQRSAIFLFVAILCVTAGAICVSQWPVWRRGWSASLACFQRAGLAISSLIGMVLASWQGVAGSRRDVLAFAAELACLCGMYVASDRWAVPLLAVMIIAVFAQPKSAIMALLAAAPLSMQPIRFGSAEFAPTELLALSAVLSLLGRAAVARIEGRQSSFGSVFRGYLGLKFTLPVGLFVAGALLSTLAATQQRESFREFRTVILEPLIIYILLLRNDDSNDISRFVDVLVLAGVAVAAVGIFQYLFTAQVVMAEDVRRVRVAYGSPNNVGLFIGRIVPLALCVGLGDAKRRWYFLALVPLVVTLTLTFSIGAWVGVAAALVFVASVYGKRMALAAAGALAALAVVLPVVANVERVVSHLSLDRGTNLSRLLLWQSAVNMLRDHPLLGIGPDNFYHLYRIQYRLPEAWREPDLSHPHNLVLDFWLRCGVIGLAAGVWILVRFFRLGFSLCRSTLSPPGRAIALGLMASGVDFVVHGFVDNSLFLTDMALIFWFSCGALEVMNRSVYNTSSVP